MALSLLHSDPCSLVSNRTPLDYPVTGILKSRTSALAISNASLKPEEKWLISIEDLQTGKSTAEYH